LSPRWWYDTLQIKSVIVREGVPDHLARGGSGAETDD
jgi:hypothetical protein